MIDPTNLVRPVTPASEFALFACCVQGKKSKPQAVKFNAWLADVYQQYPQYLGRPFELIRNLPLWGLPASLMAHKIGQYTRLQSTWKGLAHKYQDGDRFTVAGLETISGIGPKTARFIVGYCFNEPVAILDVHMLAYLSTQNICVPNETPQNRKRYAELEAEVLRIAQELGVHPLDFDYAVWKRGSKA